MTSRAASLHSIVAKTVTKPVAPELASAARHVAGLHEGGVLAVLAYGSTLRDASAADTLIDLYVLTDGFGPVSANPLSRLACRLVPPNVAYAETAHGGQRLRIKYAVLPFETFRKKVAPEADNPYFWARFAQPCRIVQAADEEARQAVIAALADAVKTMMAASLPLAGDGDDVLAVWRRGLQASYASELRPEGAARAAAIVETEPNYYEAAGRAVLAGQGVAPRSRQAGERAWRRRQRRGKVLSVFRLMKAAFTFTAGADYLAWKISRHSGIEVELRPWQRRHPILGALVLLPSLRRKGAVR